MIIELLRQKQEQSAIESRDIMANLRELAYINDSDLNFESDNDDTFNDTTSIQYGSIIIGENGITTIQQDGSIHGVQPEEEADYISKVEAGLMISSTKLNEKQKILLDSYKKKINDQHKL
jgi:flagellar basal body rod protein FlgF